MLDAGWNFATAIVQAGLDYLGIYFVILIDRTGFLVVEPDTNVVKPVWVQEVVQVTENKDFTLKGQFHEKSFQTETMGV